MNWRSVRLLALIPIWFSIGEVALPQEPDRIYRLGVLSASPGTLQRLRAVMFPELAGLGFTEGRNLVVEARFGPMEELPALARQLAAAHPDAIIAAGNAIDAAQQATRTSAIIGAFIGEDPIAAGFATTLSRPGGNVTGVAMLAPELDGKRLQLLHLRRYRACHGLQPLRSARTNMPRTLRRCVKPPPMEAWRSCLS